MRLGDGTGRNGIITSYEVRYSPTGDGGDKVTVQTSNNATSLIISGLEQKLVYEVSIAAINSQGTGPAIVAKLPTMGRSCGLRLVYTYMDCKGNTPEFRSLYYTTLIEQSVINEII